MQTGCKEFAYLVQARKDWDYFKELQTDNSDLYVLTFKTPLQFSDGVTTVHYPKSSWNEGRNKLFELAKDKGYKYLIFLDDDIVCSHYFNKSINPFRYLEACLTYYQPASACGAYEWHFKRYRTYENSIQTIKMFDACLHAMSVECAKQVLPYWTEWDKISWWRSQYIVCQTIAAKFPSRSINLNHLKVLNTMHDDYPRCANDYEECYQKLIATLTPEQAARVDKWEDCLYKNDGEFIASFSQ